MKRIVLVISVVTLASKMEENALAVGTLDGGPERLAGGEFFALNRSNTSTLASMARPMVRMMPAMPGRGEHEVEARHHAEEQHDVDQQRDARQHAREPVIDEHEGKRQQQADHAAGHAAPDGTVAQRGGHAAFLLDAHGRGERVFQRAGEVLRLGRAEVAGDAHVAAEVPGIEAWPR